MRTWSVLVQALASLTLTSGVPAAMQQPARTAVRFGHLWDGTRLMDNAVVTIQGVLAGADSVEHGIEIDDDTFAEMVRRGTVWVPTIDHNRYYLDAKDEYGFKPESIPALEDYIAKNLEAARRAVKAGVKIGMGSDAVYTMFGQNTRELEWLVKAGMTPAQALAAATTTAAELLDQKDRLGRIAPAFAADLVAVEGRPLEDIHDVIAGVRWVMKDGGRVVVP